jgi:membrane protein
LSTATEARRRTERERSGRRRLTARDWLGVFKRSGREFLSDDCMGLSQQIAYSSLLAFFPAMIFLLAVLNLIGAYGVLQDFLEPIAPQSVLNIIEQLQRDTTGGFSVLAAALGIFGALWAGSGATSSLVKAVNRAYDKPETRPLWKVRLISLVLLLASGTVLAGMFLLIVLGGKLGDAVVAHGYGGAFTWFWNLARWPLAFVVILLLFAFIYYVAPNVEQRSWEWITPGSLVGSLTWLALTGLFSLYTSFSGSFSRTYGSLASGIILLLWLNYSAWAILFGAELNSELDRRAEIRPREDPTPAPSSPAGRDRPNR